MEINAHKILSTHQISVKTNRRKNGTVDQYYSIQFTYPKRKKQQFTGKTEEEVRQKVYRYFGVSCMTFRELYEQWQTDSNLSSVEQAKARSSRYGFARYVDELGTMIAAEVTPEDILDAGKHHIESGCKTGSANTQIRNINYMYEYGIKRGFVETNPAAKVKRFRVKETQYERYYLTDRQIYEFLVACKELKEYIFAVFFICGIDMGRFIPLRWKDVDFKNYRIDVNRRMENRKSFEIVELERTEKVIIEEPIIAFDFLKMELAEQAERIGLTKKKLAKSAHFITTHPGTTHNTSIQAFADRLGDMIKRKIKADYKMSDIFYTSAVYAFKAECDLPSVASIIGYNKAIDMFRTPEKYDLFERKKKRNVNDYYDELYFGKNG